jgi:protein tyrosine phosphatase (PTP) superfamily phosphohydrolase (DUF442 family)
MNKVNVCIAILAWLFVCNPVSAQTEPMHSGPVMNYHRIDDRLVTGGHFVDEGMKTIQAEGIKVIIDLRDEPPEGQKEKLAALGIQWINIPIVWTSPEAADYDEFRKVMSAHQGDHVMVQCAANYRASAMTYLYRVKVEQISEEQAAADMNAIWNPIENERWSRFIEDITTSDS